MNAKLFFLVFIFGGVVFFVGFRSEANNLLQNVLGKRQKDYQFKDEINYDDGNYFKENLDGLHQNNNQQQELETKNDDITQVDYDYPNDQPANDYHFFEMGKDEDNEKTDDIFPINNKEADEIRFENEEEEIDEFATYDEQNLSAELQNVDQRESTKSSTYENEKQFETTASEINIFEIEEDNNVNAKKEADTDTDKNIVEEITNSVEQENATKEMILNEETNETTTSNNLGDLELVNPANLELEEFSDDLNIQYQNIEENKFINKSIENVKQFEIEKIVNSKENKTESLVDNNKSIDDIENKITILNENKDLNIENNEETLAEAPDTKLEPLVDSNNSNTENVEIVSKISTDSDLNIGNSKEIKDNSDILIETSSNLAAIEITEKINSKIDSAEIVDNKEMDRNTANYLNEKRENKETEIKNKNESAERMKNIVNISNENTDSNIQSNLKTEEYGSSQKETLIETTPEPDQSIQLMDENKSIEDIAKNGENNDIPNDEDIQLDKDLSKNVDVFKNLNIDDTDNFNINNHIDEFDESDDSYIDFKIENDMNPKDEFNKNFIENVDDIKIDEDKIRKQILELMKDENANGNENKINDYDNANVIDNDSEFEY